MKCHNSGGSTRLVIFNFQNSGGTIKPSFVTIQTEFRRCIKCMGKVFFNYLRNKERSMTHIGILLWSKIPEPIGVIKFLPEKISIFTIAFL